MIQKGESIDLDRWFVPLLCLNLFVWVLARFISDTNLDPYGDMLENFAWGQEFSWGTNKHPPLTGWVTGLWFAFMPRYDTAYHLLSYLNVMLGLLGMHRVAVTMGFARIAAPSVLLLAIAFPYSTLAVKFNANAILLSVWPWVVFGWLKSQREGGSKGLWWTIFFGIVSALALLGKYYSGVLMIALLLTSFSSEQGRMWLKTFKPWLAGGVFFLALLPHMMWLTNNDFISVAYISEQSGGDRAYKGLLKFVFAPILYWFFPLIFCAWVSSAGIKSTRLRFIGWCKNLGGAWRCQGWDDTLFWLVMLPWLLTICFGLSGIVDLSLPWAIPLGFGFPLLWIRNLWEVEIETIISHHHIILKIFSAWLLLIVLGSPLYAFLASATESKNYYRPRVEAAHAILDLWQEEVPDEQLYWVAGLWPENGLISFYGDPGIMMLPGPPDSAGAKAVSSIDWRQKAGLILCPRKQAATPPPTFCARDMQRWLKKNKITQTRHRVRVKKTGFRFLSDWEFEYFVYIYLPKKGANDNDD